MPSPVMRPASQSVTRVRRRGKLRPTCKSRPPPVTTALQTVTPTLPTPTAAAASGTTAVDDPRVLFLTLYPEEAPSPRYRVYQMLPELRRLGIDCEARPLLDAEGFRLSRKAGRRPQKAAAVAAAAARRLRDVRAARQFDLVYVLKGAFFYGPPVFERMLAKSGVPLLFDFDDAIHIPQESVHHRFLDRLKSHDRVPETIGLASQVVVPNEYLAEYSRQFHDRVSVVAEAENCERLTPRPPHAGKARVIGWVGSPSAAVYLNECGPALAEICRRHPDVVLRVIGGQFEYPGVRVEHVPWVYENEREQFHGLDIGLMPLPMEEWSRGKSGCKLRQYMASGVPGVATRIGYNVELVEDGVTGFLCESTDDWVDTLDRLVEDSDLRNRIADAARPSVVERFAIPPIARRLADVLREVHARNRAVGATP